MKRLSLLLAAGLLLADYENACAMTTGEYSLLQEMISLSVIAISIILAVAILQSLRGSVLSRPWAFFIVAFTLMGVASLLRLFDLKSILFGEYDLRLALLVTRSAAMLFMLVGLILYKKEI